MEITAPPLRMVHVVVELTNIWTSKRISNDSDKPNIKIGEGAW